MPPRARQAYAQASVVQTAQPGLLCGQAHWRAPYQAEQIGHGVAHRTQPHAGLQLVQHILLVLTWQTPQGHLHIAGAILSRHGGSRSGDAAVGGLLSSTLARYVLLLKNTYTYVLANQLSMWSNNPVCVRPYLRVDKGVKKVGFKARIKHVWPPRETEPVSWPVVTDEWQ